mgnify:FL=1
MASYCSWNPSSKHGEAHLAVIGLEPESRWLLLNILDKKGENPLDKSVSADFRTRPIAELFRF